MLNSIHAVLFRNNRNLQPSSGDFPIPRDETIAALDRRNQVEVTGLVAALPNGRYSYSLRPFDRASPQQTQVGFEKSSASIKLSLPSPGLYEITIADQLNTPRVSLVVGAVKAGQSAQDLKLFHNVQALLRAWNEDYQGWPIHDFQRAYLEALIFHFSMVPGPIERAAEAERGRFDETTEPRFSPHPGVFANDMAVILRCGTAGATIYYTVDGSQPFKTSAVYHAPIMVKGTALTIKVFATSEGKKDSAVVTGIFRIEHHESR